MYKLLHDVKLNGKTKIGFLKSHRWEMIVPKGFIGDVEFPRFIGPFCMFYFPGTTAGFYTRIENVEEV